MSVDVGFLLAVAVVSNIVVILVAVGFGSKIAPRWLRMAPRWPQNGSKMAPRWSSQRLRYNLGCGGIRGASYNPPHPSGVHGVIRL